MKSTKAKMIQILLLWIFGILMITYYANLPSYNDNILMVLFMGISVLLFATLLIADEV